MPDDKQVADSYEYCRKIARAAARNFYYGFALLPPEKRNALCALYAFMRHADDISDSDADANKSRRLVEWRTVVERALRGDYGESRGWPAFHLTVNRYVIPVAYSQELL